MASSPLPWKRSAATFNPPIPRKFPRISKFQQICQNLSAKHIIFLIRKLLSEYCWSHGVQAKSPVAGNPCVCKLFFGGLSSTLSRIKRSKSNFDGKFCPYSIELRLGFFCYLFSVLCSKDKPSTQLLTYVIFLAPLKMVSQGYEHCLVPSFLDIVLIKDEPTHIIYQTHHYQQM